MAIHPLEFIGAFLAAAIVLAGVKIKENGWRHYRLRTLLILMTAAAIVLGAVGYSLRK